MGVDLILVVCSWIVWRGGWFPRGHCVRFPRREDRTSGPPSDSHVDCCHGCASAVHHVVWVFFLIQALFNLTAVWAQPGCNFPVLGQIVTGKDRNKVMCWEMAFENTMATIIGSNAVPYVINLLGSDNIKCEGKDLEQARALGTAQAI